MTPEIRWLLILAVLFALVAVVIETSRPPSGQSAWDVLVGDALSFTTRRIPARDLLDEP
jgi:hypothetical protein